MFGQFLTTMYTEQAATGLESVISGLDLSIILDNYLLVLPVGLGVWLAVMATRKGVSWMKSFVRGA